MDGSMIMAAHFPLRNMVLVVGVCSARQGCRISAEPGWQLIGYTPPLLVRP